MDRANLHLCRENRQEGLWDVLGPLWAVREAATQTLRIHKDSRALCGLGGAARSLPGTGGGEQSLHMEWLMCVLLPVGQWGDRVITKGGLPQSCSRHLALMVAWATWREVTPHQLFIRVCACGYLGRSVIPDVRYKKTDRITISSVEWPLSTSV